LTYEISVLEKNDKDFADTYIPFLERWVADVE